MSSFYMNGYLWHVRFVNPDSPELVDRTHMLRAATTDPKTLCIYLSTELYGWFLTRVLVHELGHCTMFSFHLLRDIHRMVRPEYWVEAEEWICNFISDYGMMIFSNAYYVLGNKAWVYVPYQLERMMKYGS